MEENPLDERYLDQVSGVCLWLHRLLNQNLTFRELRVLCPQGLCPGF